MNYIALLRGAPLTILFAILQEGGRASISKLVKVTGYSKPTVVKACEALAENGFATENMNTFVLIGTGLQELLGGEKIFLPTTTVNNNQLNNTTMLTAEAEKTFSNPHFKENKKMLSRCGIGQPALDELADLPHVTPDYLNWIIPDWRKSGGAPGLLIHRVRLADPQPDVLPVDPNDPNKYTTGPFAKFLAN